MVKYWYTASAKCLYS